MIVTAPGTVVNGGNAKPRLETAAVFTFREKSGDLLVGALEKRVGQTILGGPVGIRAEDPGKAAGSAEHIHSQNQIGEPEQHRADQQQAPEGAGALGIVGNGLAQHAADDHGIADQQLFHHGILHLQEGHAGDEENGYSSKGKDHHQIPQPRLFQQAEGDEIQHMAQGKNEDTQIKFDTQQHIGAHAGEKSQPQKQAAAEVPARLLALIDQIYDPQHHKPAAGDALQPKTAENIVDHQTDCRADEQQQIAPPESKIGLVHGKPLLVLCSIRLLKV